MTTDPATADQNVERIVCGSCGSVPDDPERARPSWSFGIERGRRTWTCVACSRRHLRSIEGKLDSDWW